MHDLFDCHGVSVERKSAGPAVYSDSYCGIVRVSGESCELACMLVCSHDLMTRTHPARVLMRDWAGELANQLAGRLKHALWNHGAGLVYVTAPAVIDAKYVRGDALPEGNEMSPMHFQSNGLPFGVWIDGVIDSKLELKPADVEPYVTEGGMLML